MTMQTATPQPGGSLCYSHQQDEQTGARRLASMLVRADRSPHDRAGARHCTSTADCYCTLRLSYQTWRMRERTSWVRGPQSAGSHNAMVSRSVRVCVCVSGLGVVSMALIRPARNAHADIGLQQKQNHSESAGIEIVSTTHAAPSHAGGFPNHCLAGEISACHPNSSQGAWEDQLHQKVVRPCWFLRQSASPRGEPEGHGVRQREKRHRAKRVRGWQSKKKSLAFATAHAKSAPWDPAKS